MRPDFWDELVNRRAAEYIGRAVLDAIRFQALADERGAENEHLRQELTLARMKIQEIETSKPNPPAPASRGKSR